MADAEHVLEELGPLPGVTISALAPNTRAMTRACALRSAGLLDEVHLLHATSQSVLQANGISRTLEEHLSDIIELAHRGKAAGLRTVAFISASFGCSIEGRIPPAIPIGIAKELSETGAVDEVVISDSTGQADPRQVSQLLTELAAVVGDFPITVHFHDSRGAALANVLSALDSPIESLTIDSGFGGLGGDVPFLPEASGNVATEDVIEMLAGMGVQTGVDVNRVLEVVAEFSSVTGWSLVSRTPAVGPVRWKRFETR
jgi:isopropylmalate/homocitrate/citramalate synthase